MELRNCPQCGKLFVYTIRNLCPECIQKNEKEFDSVRDYLNKNPRANLEEVSESTGVSVKKILEYLKEGRLILRNDSNIILKCEHCDTPILSGRLCEKCSRKLRTGLSSQTKKSLYLDEDMKGKIHLSKIRSLDKRIR